MPATFSPSQVATMTNVSLAAVRSYCDRFGAYFSPGARPPKGSPREFTAEDVRLVAFIRERTKNGDSHALVMQAIAAGELAEFTHWQSPTDPGAAEPESQPQTQPQGQAGVAGLMTGAQAQALQTLLDDYRRREETLQARTEQVATAAQQRERELHDQIAALQRELGKAEGELAALKQRRPWWKVWA